MNAVTKFGVDSGIENGGLLIAFTDAVAGTDPAALDAARAALEKAMGASVVAEASLIAANFSMLDRIANAVGIPVDGMILPATIDFRERLGINQFLSANNTPMAAE